MVEIAHQRRAGLAAGHVTRGATHIDVDDVGAGGFRDPRALGHPVRLAARELHHMRPHARGFAAQPGNGAALRQVVARGHFRDDKPRPEFGGEPSEGRVCHARHGRQKNRVGEVNIAYFQWLTANIFRAGHETSRFSDRRIIALHCLFVSTFLVQSSCLPTL